MVVEMAVDEGEAVKVQLTRRRGLCTVRIDGQPYTCSLTQAGDHLVATVESRTAAVWAVCAGDEVFVHAFGRHWTVRIRPAGSEGGHADADTSIAPMPGVVVAVHASEGSNVAAGDLLLTIESMKMQTQITAARAGSVERIHLQIGDSFDRGATLVTLQHDQETGG